MAQLLPKTGSFIAQINQMVASGRIDNDLMLQIETEIPRMKQNGLYVDALELQGMIAACRGNIDELDRKFSGAVTASGGSASVLMNYSKALSNVHLHRRAKEYARRAVERAPDDAAIISDAARIAVDAFDVDLTETLLSRLTRLNAALSDQRLPADLELRRSIIATANANGDDLAERMELAANVLRARGVVANTVVESVCDDTMLFEFAIDADPEQLVGHEAAIHDAIASCTFSNADLAVTFSCTPFAAVV